MSAFAGPESRYRAIQAQRRAGRSEAVESGVKVIVLDLGVVAAVERSDALPDRNAQLFQPERFLGAALLQRADRVAYGRGRPPSGPRDERVLLGRQSDVAGGHRLDLIDCAYRHLGRREREGSLKN